MKDLKDRVAVVTGAASGIGRAMAESFLDAGMQVVLADIDEERLESNLGKLKNFDAGVLAVPTDVSQAAQVEALAKKRSINSVRSTCCATMPASAMAAATVGKRRWKAGTGSSVSI
jgi:NADP-dependent 3-hydroxy acid dehydrogenase YdfG